tara:strand:- start:296 stop:664 length:369 start_codon:yes stop_codon:yes gene_type:complete
MAHFAKINNDNIVEQVIVVNNDAILDKNNTESEKIGIDFCKSLLGKNTNWIQTSYNSNFRKNFAEIGGTYDVEADGFYAPQPFNSWILNEETFNWEAPVEYPSDENYYTWNEETISWDLVTE